MYNLFAVSTILFYNLISISCHVPSAHAFKLSSSSFVPDYFTLFQLVITLDERIELNPSDLQTSFIFSIHTLCC